MARTFVKIGIFLLIVHALYRFVPVYFHYQQFKDGVHETALFSRERNEAQIADIVMELAEKYQIPLSRESVQIRREGGRTLIDATCTWSRSNGCRLYKRPWQFDIGE